MYSLSDQCLATRLTQSLEIVCYSTIYIHRSTITPSYFSPYNVCTCTATRVQQAELFNSTDNACKIMVATDAIGMGLNL